MFVDYEDYKELSNTVALSEDDYERIAPIADLVVDHWTLGRTARASANGEELPSAVKAVYTAVVNVVPSVLEESKGGERVTSFSNGVDTFSFASEPLSARLWSQLGWMAELLPVEWISACVGYEGGADAR